MSEVIVNQEVQIIVSEGSESLPVILINDALTNTVESVSNNVLLIQEFAATIITEGAQGLQGIAGIVEEEMLYAKRIDFITDNLLYRGEAAVGALNSAPVWRIRKVSIGTDGDISETWVNGNANFTNVWDSRLSGVYS